MSSWRARRRATNPGAGASPWRSNFGGARPGRGHLALASLYRAGKVPGVVTQNIDNLHQASGIKPRRRHRTARQHDLRALSRLQHPLRARLGEGDEWTQAMAARPIARTAAASSRPRPSHSARRCPMPQCSARRTCHSPAICFWRSARRLLVWPAAGFPLMAKRHGARLVIINREATDFDAIADLVVRQDIGTVLEPLIVH